MGSPGLAAWIAQFTCWVLLALGVGLGELTTKRAAIFVALWLAGYFGLPRMSSFGGLLITSYVAVPDIVLVFMVFKGDVRIG